MPYWRKAEEYRFQRDFPRFRWAWEFLRRNPNYRADWASALSRFLASPEDFGLDTPEPVPFDGGWHPDPKHPHFYLSFAEKERWGLRDFVNPETDDPFFLAFTLQFGYLYTFHKDGPQEPRGAQYPWAFFNLNLPIKPQLETVGRMLAAAQKRQGIKPRQIKHHRKLWPRYLRLLDAELDGRTPKQTADALEEEEVGGLDERKIWDQLQAAKKMTEPDGYLSIFLSA